MIQSPITRRAAIAGAAALAAGGAVAAQAGALRKAIPSTGEMLPAIGMGSWRTFDVDGEADAVAQRTDVLRTFFEHGGAVVDSSPMYGTSQTVIGKAMGALSRPNALFSADKVWTSGDGASQIATSARRWGLTSFDLLQVHNLVDWRRHLPELLQMKADGRLRYVGVTSYAGIAYDEVARIMESQPVDFVQVTYNVVDREAEQRILPLAFERKIAVIANRPFREGQLFERFRERPLPAIAAEIGALSWAQFMLKFVISHPALTVAVPATSRVDHMRENMAAMAGVLPDESSRAAMAAAVSA
jgi:diketogulonate reductase-like aldo/keto reductase